MQGNSTQLVQCNKRSDNDNGQQTFTSHECNNLLSLQNTAH